MNAFKNKNRKLKLWKGLKRKNKLWNQRQKISLKKTNLSYQGIILSLMMGSLTNLTIQKRIKVMSKQKHKKNKQKSFRSQI